MSVILLGYHNMGCRALKVLKELDIFVPAVFTHKDNPKENIWFDSLAKLSEEFGIPVYYPENINEDKWVKLLKELKPDILLSCYFRDMIKSHILEIPKIAAVNLHGSLLPKYRGRCPVNWQLVHGETESGVTLHHMVEKADAGDIIAQKKVKIDFDDTATTLFRKLEDAAEELLRTYIPKLLDGTAPRLKQDHSKASYFGGRRPEDGKIDFSKDATSIYNLIRAVTWPYPGAFCKLNDKKLYIWKAMPVEDLTLSSIPGQVIIKDRDVFIQTGKGMLKIISASFEHMPKGENYIPKELYSQNIILK